jgi:hypothetical protein
MCDETSNTTILKDFKEIENYITPIKNDKL